MGSHFFLDKSGKHLGTLQPNEAIRICIRIEREQKNKKKMSDYWDEDENTLTELPEIEEMIIKYHKASTPRGKRIGREVTISKVFDFVKETFHEFTMFD